MFGIGTPELLIIVVVALLIFGPSKLPELGKTLGKGLREFKKASSDLRDQVNPLAEVEDKKELNASSEAAGKETKTPGRKRTKKSSVSKTTIQH